MGKVVTKARRLRLEYQLKLGRSVPLQEVADATGIERAALNRIELGKTTRIDFDTLSALCAFYKVGVGDILEYDEDAIQASSLPPRMVTQGAG